MKIKKENVDYFNVQYSFNNQYLNINKLSTIHKVLDDPEIDLNLLKKELIKLNNKKRIKKLFNILSITTSIAVFFIETLLRRVIPNYVGYINLFITFILPIAVFEYQESKKNTKNIIKIIETIDTEIKDNKLKELKKIELNAKIVELEEKKYNNIEEKNFFSKEDSCKKRIRKK